MGPVEAVHAQGSGCTPRILVGLPEPFVAGDEIAVDVDRVEGGVEREVDRVTQRKGVADGLLGGQGLVKFTVIGGKHEREWSKNN